MDAMILGRRQFLSRALMPWLVGAQPASRTEERSIGEDRTVDVRKYGARGDGTSDDATAVRSALLDAGDDVTVFFPAGDYLLGSQIRTTAPGQRLTGEAGTTLRRRAHALLDEGPARSAAYCLVYIAHPRCSVSSLIIDGNVSRMGWPVDPDWLELGYRIGTNQEPGALAYNLLIAASDCRIEAITVHGSYSGRGYGGGLMLRACERAFVSNVAALDNGGDGVNVFGQSSDVLVVGSQLHGNGVAGLEIEGDGEANPRAISAMSVAASRNAGNNVNVIFGRDVTLSGITSQGGGNNGAINVGSTERLSLTNFTVRSPRPHPRIGGGANGVWLHAERPAANLGSAPNRQIVISNGVVSDCGDERLGALGRGDGIRISDNCEDVTIAHLSSRGARNGFGLAIDTTNPALLPCRRLRVLGCDFGGNASGPTSGVDASSVHELTVVASSF